MSFFDINAIFSLANLAVWFLDSQTEQMQCTAYFLKLLGLSEETELSWPIFLGQLSPESQTTLQQALHNALSYGESSEVELELASEDTVQWLTCKIQRLTDTKFQAVVRDISKNKRTELYLLKSLQQLDGFNYALNQNTLVWIRDLKGLITHVNQKVCEISGYRQNELVGHVRYFHHLAHYPHDYVRQVHERVMQKQQWRGELLCRSQNGSEYWLDVTTTPILNEDHQITHMVSMGRLITQRKRTEAALHRFEAGLKTLTNLQSDFQLSFKQKIQQALQLMMTYFDVTSAFLFMPQQDARAKQKYGVSFSQGDFHGVDMASYLAWASPLIKEASCDLSVHALQDPLLPSGCSVWGSMLKNAQLDSLGVLAFFDEREGPHFRIDEDREFFDLFCAWLTTVIERHHFLERITESNEGKDRLMTILAHDLRSPLSAVSGFTELLLDEVVDRPHQTLESHQDLLESLKEATQRSLLLIQSILEFERLGEKSYIPRFESVDFKMWLTHHLRVPRVQAERYLLAVNLTLLSEDVYVNLDPPVFSRVITNLMQNACKFTPSGGTINVSLTAESLGGAPMAHLKICDTGIGIPEDKLKLVFSREQIIRRPGLRGEASNGMGLVIVKRIVELHHGYLRVESQENKGTCISIMLPRPKE